MPSTVTRLAGALLVESGRHVFLVGNTKVPCDFRNAGFEAPDEVDAMTTPCLALSRLSSDVGVRVGKDRQTSLVVSEEGLPAAQQLAKRFLIRRNGSVSERLWRLVFGAGPEAVDDVGSQKRDGDWLMNMPDSVWEIVRDTVLRC